MRVHRDQNRFRSSEIRRVRPDGEQYQATGMKGGLTFVRVFVQLGMSVALTTVAAVSIFMIIRYVAWVG